VRLAVGIILAIINTSVQAELVMIKCEIKQDIILQELEPVDGMLGKSMKMIEIKKRI